MKIRIKFTKQGEMRFIGHLDFMRFFQKVLRRAGIDIRFSEGISPHMILSFASPLGVGLTGSGEYADIEINTPVSTREALDRLNACSVEEVRFLDFRQIGEGRADKAMALVAAADYEIRFREGSEPEPLWTERFREFLAQEHIEVTREKKKALKKAAGKNRKGRDKEKCRAKTGQAVEQYAAVPMQVVSGDGSGAAGGESAQGAPEGGGMPGGEETTQTLDIRGLIFAAEVIDPVPALPGAGAAADPAARGGAVRLRLSSGSAENLRPELVMKAFMTFCGRDPASCSLAIDRLELLARDPAGEGFISLQDLGTPIG